MREHVYVSTACLHEEHGRCRRTCKFCAAPCQCECHADNRNGPLAYDDKGGRSRPKSDTRAP